MKQNYSRFSSFNAFAKAFGAIAKSAFEEQRPYRQRFLARKGHTDETFNYLPQDLKDALQMQWVKSPEFKEMNDACNK